jgi:hypothetical protein
MLVDQRKEQISIEVIKTLYSRFESFPEDSLGNRNAPFHEAFLNAFSDKLEGNVTNMPMFISLSSWLHGLNTTLGQSFFENTAHILSDGYKKSYTASNNNLLRISRLQKEHIADIITDLKNGTQDPNRSREDDLIFEVNDGQSLDANSFTVDVYVESADRIDAIELKSVKPNAGEMRGEKQKILEAKAALHNNFPNKAVRYYMGFPFDPTSAIPTAFDKQRFLESVIDGLKYFAPDEILLADELWDLLSGDRNTMSQLLDIINRIATPDFLDNYNYLNDSANRSNTEYTDLLNDWMLYGEKMLVENDDILNRLIINDSSLTRKYRQPMFIKGGYNSTRYRVLTEAIS